MISFVSSWMFQFVSTTAFHSREFSYHTFLSSYSVHQKFRLTFYESKVSKNNLEVNGVLWGKSEKICDEKAVMNEQKCKNSPTRALWVIVGHLATIFTTTLQNRRFSFWIWIILPIWKFSVQDLSISTIISSFHPFKLVS